MGGIRPRSRGHDSDRRIAPGQIRRIREEGGEILYGGESLEGPQFSEGHYVRTCIALAKNGFAIVQEETFAPILYIIGYGEALSSRR
jgi:acyl-CoA reductase-like NAD-dependent aldehyde dehydrogenase